MKMMSKLLVLKEKLGTFGRDEEGATMIEYALIAALISVVAILLLTNIGTQLQTVFQSVLTALGG